jgi:hypothetical protein
MRKLYAHFLLGFVLILCSFAGFAQVSVTATAGTTGPTAYTTVKAAFDAINAGTHQGAITIGISASTTESAPAILNGSGMTTALYTSVSIRPTADAVSISGATVAGRGVIELNGADNVTIDGDNAGSAGTNRDLSVINTAANTIAFTSVIRIATGTGTGATDANNITIKNVVVTGNATVKNFSGSTSTTGAENTTFGVYAGGNGGATVTPLTSITTNTAASGTTINGLLVDNCAFDAAARAVVFNGAAATVSTGVTISNNLIGNQSALAGNPPFVAPATTVYTRGVFIAGTNAFTISGNSIKNIISYVGTALDGIEISTAIGTGAAVIQNNTISGVVNNGTSGVFGINLLAAAGTFTIAGNTVTNIQGTGGSQSIAGIQVSYAGTAATIEANKISTVYNRTTNGWGSYGLNLNGGNNILVRNNMIWDVNAFLNNGALSTSFGPNGLRIASGTGHKIYHNSVNMYGAILGTSAFTSMSALLITATTLTGIDVRNNIFVNTMTGAPASSAVVAIMLPSGGTSAMNLTLNNNAYYSGTDPLQGIAQVGTTSGSGLYTAPNFNGNATTPATNLRAYTSTLSAGGTNDNSSVAFNTATPFVSNTDLHINLGLTPTRLESGGAVVGTTTDIDGQVRPGPVGSVNGGGLAPDMGADEFDGVFVDVSAPIITYTPLVLGCSTGDRTLSATITDLSGVPTTGGLMPRIYFRKNGGAWFSNAGTLASGTGTNGTWNFAITSSIVGGLVAGDVIQYYLIAQDVSTAANISSAPSGAVATNVNTVTVAPVTPSSYAIGVALNGTFTVGAGGNYTTLTSAVTAYNNGCLAGPVVFNLTDATYSAGETFPLTISNGLASATNSLTIKPASGVTTTISGSLTNNALVRILSSYVTIDGSNNGTTSQNLTLTNTNTTGPSVVLIGSVGTVPVKGSTLKNAIVINGVNTASAVVVSDATTLGNPGYFNDITLTNLSVQKAYIGIYTTAAAGLGNGNITISNNLLNATGANAIRLAAIYTQGTDGATISGNTIGNLESTTAETDYGIWAATDSRNTTISGNTISDFGTNTTAGGTPRGINVTSGLANANVKISGNTITNMTTSGTGSPQGIVLSGTTSGVSITENKVSNIKNTNTGGWGSEGIMLGSTSVTANVLVANNFVSDVASFGFNGSGVSDNGYGLFIASGAGYNIYHNTIVLNTNQSGAGQPAAVNVNSGVTVAGAVNLVNNIIVNTQTMGTLHYALLSTATNSVFGTIDYNDYYTASGPIAVIGATDRADLAAIQAGFGQNTKSLTVAPTFTSATDFHLPAATNAALDSKGTPLAAVTIDIDLQARSNGAPDMGADEFGTICFLPSITTQPTATTTVCLGANVTLSVTAGNTVSYQWQLGGVDVPGATSSTLSLTNITAAQAGTYTVKLTGSGGCLGPITSANATVVINQPPVITTQPVNQTACVGTTATFSVVATGTSLTYQWLKNGGPIGGATSATYSINPVAAGDAGTYSVVVTGICGSPVTSGNATLGTNAAPTITTQPLTQGACIGNPVNFSVVASGGGLTYQWFKNGNPIGGAINSTFTIPVFAATDAGNYTVSITSPCATNTTSNIAVLSVNTNAAITTQPQTQVACAGTPATFSVTATGSGLSYQWRKGGTPIAGATNATYTIASVSGTDVASYDVVVTGACNTVTSTGASLIMTNPPVIISQPTNQAACANGSATFSVSATGTGLSYQWFNGANPIAGANTNTYTVNPVTAAGSYKVVVTGICGTPLSSNTVTLSINQPVVITAQPTAQSVCATSNTTFSVTATGTNLTYQWRKAGVAIPGATAATYVITNTPLTAAGNYDVVITGACNSATSSSVALTVNPAIALTSFIGSGTVCAGSTAAFSVTATSTGSLTYQWRKNGVAITGATNATYAINSAAATDAGNYDVVVSGQGTCTLTSGIIAMTVNTTCVTAVPNLNADVSSVILLPNLVRQNATLQVTVRRSMKIEWNVTDAQGRVVLRFTQQAVAGSTNNIPVQASQLAGGVYQITGITTNGKTSVVRFVKL